MRIGLLTQWYDPEPGPAALPGTLARGLVARGHQVSVLTGFPNYPTGRLPEGWRMSRVQRRLERGVSVTRVALYPSHDASTARRMANYGSFGASALVNGLSALRGADAIWVNYSPITVAPAMFAARYLHGTPLICHIGDLWPDTLTAGGFAPSHPVLGRAVDAALHRWCDAMYAASEVVTYIAPGVHRLLRERGVPEEALAYAPMWAEESTFRPADSETRAEGAAWRRELGVSDDDVLCLYAGAIGRAQGLGTLVEAVAGLRREHPELAARLRVVVVGSGVAEDELRAQVGASGVGDVVTFAGRVPQERMPTLMAAADVCFVGLAATPLSAVTMPSKTQATLAAGKALLVAADGDIQQVVADSGAGWAVDSGDAARLTEAMVSVCQSGRDGLARRGAAARAHYDREFSLDVALDRAEAHLTRARDARRGGPTR
ncbi:MAG: glycosyltransferase family 4 protein [Mobilicoccus sp.]|nr:glycosyltransferase family 4 protein [Mobilicoccus sp.]